MTALGHRLQGYFASLVNLAKVTLLVLFSYLLQVSVVPHLKVGEVMPNLLMVCIAVLTVSKGKKYAFASGAVIGILLETMASNLRLFNLLMYPALALLCAQIFADMSELRRELLRIRIAQRQTDGRSGAVVGGTRRRKLRARLRRKTADDLDPHLRILLNALMLTLLYEGIMIVYIALEGVSPTWGHVGRVLSTLLYTGVASLLMFPARAFLSMYRFSRRGKRAEDSLGDEVRITDRDLRSITLEPDLPQMRGMEPMVVEKEAIDPETKATADEDSTEGPDGTKEAVPGDEVALPSQDEQPPAEDIEEKQDED